LRALAIALGSCGVLACSASEDFGEETAHSREIAIAGGTQDDNLVSVFSLQARYASTSRRCTALLIAPNLFLTARHCLIASDVVPTCDDDFPALVDPSSIDLTNPTRLDSIEAETTPVVHGSLIITPEGGSLCGDDLALVMTVELVDTTPASLRLASPPEPGEAYSAAGYGLLGELIGGEGTRRSRAGLHFECDTAGCAPTLVTGEILGEAGPCEGDSGGPALDSDGLAVGILSRGTVSCETPIYEILFAHREWLRASAETAALAGDYPLPTWAEPPQPTNPGGAPATEGGAGGAAGSVSSPEGGTTSVIDESSAASDEGCACSWVGGSTVTAGRPFVLGALLVLAANLRRARRRRATRPTSPAECS
jgi:hypothetical protein